MPIPLPNLDDRLFEPIVEDATKLIPRLAPDWTDHNRHDPGITFIELFSWLEEMLAFYLNQVRDENYWKFLKLLGIRRRDATPASAHVSFALTAPTTTRVPIRAKLRAGTTIFETTEEITVTTAALRIIASASATGLKDNTEANLIEGLTYPAFGDLAESGSRLYLGFENLDQAAAHPFSLTIRMREDYPIARGQHGGEPPIVIPSALITWEYSDTAGQWRPLGPIAELQRIFALFPQITENRPFCAGIRQRILAEVEASPLLASLTQILDRIHNAQQGAELTALLTDPEILLSLRDETLMFSRSGRIFFSLPADLGTRPLPPFQGAFHWLRATVKSPGFELAPRLDSIRIHTVPAHQTDTISEVRTFSITAALTYEFPSTFLEQNGDCFIQIAEQPDTWTDWQLQPNLSASTPTDRHFTITRINGIIRIQFGDNTNGLTPPQADNNARLVSHTAIGEARTFSITSALTYDFPASFLEPTGRGFIQIVEPPGVWNDWQLQPDLSASTPTDRHFTITRTANTVRIQFGDNTNGLTPPQGNNNARLIANTTNARESLLIGTSKGLPHLEALLPRTPVIATSLHIQAQQPDTTWRDYQLTATFDTATPTDRVFTLNPDTGIIRFGDGINGLIPPPLDPRARNIRAIAYSTGGGLAGNVPANAITELAGPTRPLTLTNPSPATDGLDGESLPEAIRRARADLRVRYRAVTFPDFVTVAKTTPGLRVARAEALPQPDTATVTVVVVPFSESEKPIPSRGFLQTVCRHLMKHRLITTRIKVTGPEYTCISVDATLTIRRGFTESATRLAADQAIRKFFHPLNGGPGGAGWPFGRTVFKSEIYQQLEQVPGVGCVESLRLSPSGSTGTRDADGNILLSPRALTCTNTIRLTFISSDDACRGKARIC